jgi:hypothetical protein
MVREATNPPSAGNTASGTMKGATGLSREAYAAEIAKIRQERPDIRVVVYDHTFQGSRAWFRFAFKWSDPKTGEPRSRAGMQSYRTEGGKLAETWLSMQPLPIVATASFPSALSGSASTRSV